jgi:chromosome segregation protein
MLKRLELVGFKSFADKTHFDFAPGVTGIIGPNGSGKSNVVDAVRWVLGEQSAKSLRGGEMTDVIFNGSASRRAVQIAEVSMTFDNAKKVLAIDAEEVRITRRVYRSGEGEYLINSQACRLKDVKDLFLGSGAGTDAYCIIQQGQVDVLLQTAPKERRAIFEEAAGISRFKARKIEALRRLERTEGNLQRLRDVLDEIEKQLRSVRHAAGKAQSYQKHHARLKELRVGESLRAYHELDGRLQVESAELARLKAELEAETAKAGDDEREQAGLEQQVTRLDAAIREQGAELSSARQTIASEQSRQAHERASCEQIEQEQAQARQRLAGMTARVQNLTASCEGARRELETVEGQCREQQSAVEANDADLAAAAKRLEELRAEIRHQYDLHFEQQRIAGQLHNDAVSYKVELDALTRARDRLLHRTEQAAENIANIDLELRDLTVAEERLQDRLGAARAELAAMREERDRLAASRDELTQQAGEIREQRSGLLSRVEVLENLERSHEGLGTGVREVFAHLEGPEPGPWSTVAGLVADLFTVRREFAPLIDLALGERAQRFVVRDARLLTQALRQRGKPFSGRVSFLHLDPAKKPPARPASTALTKGGLTVASERMHPGAVPAE